MIKNFITLFVSLFCMTSSISYSETLSLKDLVKRNNIYYQKFQNNPFTGKIETYEGSLFYREYFKYGKRDGKYEIYDNRDGTIVLSGNFTKGEKSGTWLDFKSNGHIFIKRQYLNGKLIECKSDFEINCKNIIQSYK